VPTGEEIKISGNAAQLVLWVFRAAVSISCLTAWNLFLDVRDLKADSVENPSLSVKDWEYEKKLLLVDHELFKNEIETLRMQLDELEDQR
jgi:hypothetical protein